jgi:hypothetical protein
MAFELFVGRVPFADTDEPMAVLMRQVSDPIPPARAIDPGVDPGISAWIEALLAKAPEERVQSAGEAWDHLEEVVLGLEGPRWRRSTGLPDRTPVAAAPARRTGTTRTTPATMATSSRTVRYSRADAAAPSTMSEAPTRRLAEHDAPAMAGTIMPRRPATAAGDSDEPPEERPRRRRRAVLASLALLLFAGFAVAAAAGGGGSSAPGTAAGGASSSAAPRSDGSGSTAPTGPALATAPAAAGATTAVTGRGLAVSVPRGWSRASRAAGAGLPLSGAVTVAPRGRTAGGTVRFGVMTSAAAANSTLLPAAFLRSIGQPTGTIPTRTAVRLPAQRLQAWRYRGLRPAGAPRELTVYVVPTTEGVAAVACSAPPAAAAAFATDCEAVAGSLRLSSGRAYPVGPSSAYAAALNSAIGGLQQAAAPEEANFAAAKTLAAQAAAARVIAIDDEAAATQLAALDVSPADRGANTQLLTALRRLATAYRRAARAATAGSAAAYRAAGGGIADAKAHVNLALAGVRAAGYAPSPAAALPPASSGARATSRPATTPTKPGTPAPSRSDVGDSRSDDPSDDSANP